MWYQYVPKSIVGPVEIMFMGCYDEVWDILKARWNLTYARKQQLQ